MSIDTKLGRNHSEGLGIFFLVTKWGRLPLKQVMFPSSFVNASKAVMWVTPTGIIGNCNWDIFKIPAGRAGT